MLPLEFQAYFFWDPPYRKSLLKAVAIHILTFVSYQFSDGRLRIPKGTRLGDIITTPSSTAEEIYNNGLLFMLS